ncbi:recombinase family protein, partial [Gemmatimonadota bacterium]
MKPRVALYARYSTDRQNPRSAQDQLDAAELYCQEKGYTVQQSWKVKDEAVSGRSISGRAGFKRLMNAAQLDKPPFDRIIVEDLTRFSRDYLDGTEALIQLARNGVVLEDLRGEIYDLDDSNSQILSAMGMWKSEQESRAIADRTKRGQKVKAKGGYSTGGPPPYGYGRKENPNTADHHWNVSWKLEPDQARIVRHIYKLYAAGSSLADIAQQLNRSSEPSPGKTYWDASTVRYILHNPVYQGKRVYGKTRRVRSRDGRKRQERVPKDQWVIHDDA